MSAKEVVAVPKHPIVNREAINRLTDDFCPHTKERWLRKSCLICIDLEIQAGAAVGREQAVKLLQDKLRFIPRSGQAGKVLMEAIASLQLMR